MKRILAFVCVFFTALMLSSCSTTLQVTDSNRSVNGFTFDSGSVYWSEVFPISDSTAVRSWFDSSFKITKEQTKSVLGETEKNSLPYEQAGYDSMTIIMLFRHPCIVYFTADFKSDRYRVTVDRIVWYPQVAVTTYGVSQGVGTMDLNSIAVKNGGYSSVFYNTSSVQLNRILTQMFTAKISKVRRDDNW